MEPYRRDAAPQLTATEARQSQPMGRMRYVLGISLSLTILGFIGAWYFGVF
jgi:hypothetical protein